jgi:Domain of unknown function (DUF4838)/Glycosyl hydrolase family 67 N-terminus
MSSRRLRLTGRIRRKARARPKGKRGPDLSSAAFGPEGNGHRRVFASVQFFLPGMKTRVMRSSMGRRRTIGRTAKARLKSAASAFFVLFTIFGFAANTAGDAQPLGLPFAAPAWWGTAGEASFERDGISACLKEGYLAHDKIAVEQGRHYSLSLQTTASDAPFDSAFVQISFRGHGVAPVWRGPIIAETGAGAEPVAMVDGGSHGWVLRSTVFETPAGADEAVVYVRRKPGSTGVVCFASVQLAQTNAPVSSPDSETQILDTVYLVPPIASAKSQAIVASMLSEARADKKADRIGLARNLGALADIYVGSKADIVTLHAATELCEYLRQITGANFLPLRSDESPNGRQAIVVGRENAFSRGLISAVAFAGLGTDGFIVRSVGKIMVIAGATPRGTLFGVYWFLENVLGVHWFAPDSTVVPRSDALAVSAVDATQAPRFAYREVLSWEGQDKDWRIHNLMNGESHGPSYLPTPTNFAVWAHSWNAKGGCANFFELIPPDKFSTSHPEWFSGGQLAMMNDDLRTAMTDVVVDRLRRLPDYRTIWFCIQDMDWGWDMDPASRRFAILHGGSAAAPRLDMMIDVADRVRRVLPEARFSFNAYHWSFAPPAGMTAPSYLLVYPMTIQVDYRTALNEETNEDLARDLRGWDDIAQHLLVWDHVVNFENYLQPHPNIRAMARSIQWLATLRHVDGYFAEGVWDTPGGEFMALRDWLIARLTWNPSQNIDALIEEFTDGYYGPAGARIREYIDLEESAVARSRDRLTEKTPIALAMFNENFLSRSDEIFDAAENLAAGTPFIDRVRRARMSIDYMILLAANSCKPSPQCDRFIASAPQRRERFWREVARSGLQRLRPGADLASFRDSLAIERHRTSAADPFAEEPLADRVNLGDTNFILFGRAETVADEAASDGAAASIRYSSDGWSVQMKLDRLPEHGDWDLVASVRTIPQPGSGPNAAVAIGSHPPMTCQVIVPARDLEGPYHFVKAPGGPFRYSRDHERFVYFQPISDEGSMEVRIDRIIALRSDTPPYGKDDASAASMNSCGRP